MGKKLRVYLVLLLSSCCIAGPLKDATVLETGTSNEVCTLKNETFTRGEVIPDIAPCETCVCEPPEIKCSMVKCPANNGCKIIQQSNRCCPEYKCDCEHEGKLYNNGEKLDNPSNPCQVCYCRGGEIMCNSITCYRRDDCEPQHVEGQCCPKYGHCPTKNLSSVVALPGDASGSNTKREMQPWLLTKSVNLQTTEAPKYPHTIKIVEILPTQNPPRSGDVSLVPRIITNGSPEVKATSPQEPSTESSTSSSELSELKFVGSEQPNPAAYTTFLPHMTDVTLPYEELGNSTGDEPEGSGYDLEKGGMFSSRVTDNSSEEAEPTKPPTTSSIVDTTKPEFELVEGVTSDNSTSSANMAESDAPVSVNTEVVTSESTGGTSVSEGMVTRHGFTIPPILNLNHQLHHLTLGGTGEEAEEKSIVRIGVYDPTKPGEMSNLVTIIKNEESASTVTSTDGTTTQILLTPQDLKTLAEMIIKEKITSPNEKLKDEVRTTPMPTEPTSLVPEVMTTKVEEGTTVEAVTPRGLSEEEKKAQQVIDRLTSSLLLPLQGIEVVGNNETMTTEAPEEATTLSARVISENKDAEWVDVTNTTESTSKKDKVVAEESTTTTENPEESTTPATPESTTTTDISKTRGSFRQISSGLGHTETRESAVDRRVRVTKTGNQQPEHAPTMLDENDRMLVENFFKKALNSQ